MKRERRILAQTRTTWKTESFMENLLGAGVCKQSQLYKEGNPCVMTNIQLFYGSQPYVRSFIKKDIREADIISIHVCLYS